MPTPQPQRSAYRDRRINAMLQEHDTEVPTSRGPLKTEVLKRSSVPAVSRRSLISIAIATASLCALAVFFVLFRRDSSPTVKEVPVPSVRSSPVVPAKAPTPEAKPIETPATPTPASSGTPPPLERIHFKLSKLKAQTFGSLSVRLMATNVRKGFCSLSIRFENAKPTQRTAQVNKPVEVATEDGKSITLLVTGVSKASVSGFVTGT